MKLRIQGEIAIGILSDEGAREAENDGVIDGA